MKHAMNRTWGHWRHEGGAQGPIRMEDYAAVGTGNNVTLRLNVDTVPIRQGRVSAAPDLLIQKAL